MTKIVLTVEVDERDFTKEELKDIVNDCVIGIRWSGWEATGKIINGEEDGSLGLVKNTCHSSGCSS